jgi:hypothetical protein
MATTISAATLTVTTTESITLNGSTMGATNTKTFAGINEISQRIVSLDAANIRIIFNFGTTVGSGTFIKGDVKYVRITNKDDTSQISLNLATATSNCWVSVEAGQSFIISSGSSTSQGVASATVAVPVLADLVKISAYSASAIDLDCYLASM